MWVLRGLSEAYAGISIWLRPNRPLTVGRKAADLVLPNEKSVSRSHAVITIHSDDAEAVRAQTDPAFRHTVTLQDAGAKFGTYLNGNNRQVAKEVLNDGDVVQFGTGAARFRLAWIPVVLTASGLRSAERNQVKALARNYDICFLDAFSPACTHLVALAIKKVNRKIVSSILNGCHIVTPEWVYAFGTIDPGNFVLPTELDFQPLIAEEEESSVGIQPQHLKPNPERKHVLQGCHFVVFAEIEGLADVVEGAGGTISTCALPKDASEEALLVQRLGEMQYPCVVAPPDTDMTAGQLASLVRVLQTVGLKLLESDDVAKAVLFMDREKFCGTPRAQRGTPTARIVPARRPMTPPIAVEGSQRYSQALRPPSAPTPAEGSQRFSQAPRRNLFEGSQRQSQEPRPVTPPLAIDRSQRQSQVPSSQDDILSILFGDDPAPKRPVNEPPEPPLPSAVGGSRLPELSAQRISLASQLGMVSRSRRRLETTQQSEADTTQTASASLKRLRADDVSQSTSQSQLSLIAPQSVAKRLRDKSTAGGECSAAASPTATTRTLRVPTVKKVTTPQRLLDLSLARPVPPWSHQNDSVASPANVPSAVAEIQTATVSAMEAGPRPMDVASTPAAPPVVPPSPPATTEPNGERPPEEEEVEQLTVVVTAPLRRQAAPPGPASNKPTSNDVPNFKRFIKTRHGPPGAAPEADERNTPTPRRRTKRKVIRVTEYDGEARELAMQAADHDWLQRL
ncbi:hypothetical protein HDU86_000814 [Geranomyces michiganensis]|nr:hypothetical protein HDU86_000814 [Geranomyces michiganensis]